MTYYSRNHIPAFGSWDCNVDDLPFTQCFESARQTGLIRCSYTEDRDLYVTGDLYENNIVTPAIIVAPRRRRYTKEAKKEAWPVACDCYEKKPPTVPVALPPHQSPGSKHVNPKAVDEDLYKISPELLRANPRRILISSLSLENLWEENSKSSKADLVNLLQAEAWSWIAAGILY